MQKYASQDEEKKDAVLRELLGELDALAGLPKSEADRPQGFTGAPKLVQEWALKVMATTDEAFEDFGMHAFKDKRVSEVLDVRGFSKHLWDMDPTEAGIRLEALAVCGRDYNTIAATLMCYLEDQETQWWHAFCQACPSVDYCAQVLVAKKLFQLDPKPGLPG